jgi:hypothetical protein
MEWLLGGLFLIWLVGLGFKIHKDIKRDKQIDDRLSTSAKNQAKTSARK